MKLAGHNDPPIYGAAPHTDTDASCCWSVRFWRRVWEGESANQLSMKVLLLVVCCMPAVVSAFWLDMDNAYFTHPLTGLPTEMDDDYMHLMAAMMRGRRRPGARRNPTPISALPNPAPANPNAANPNAANPNAANPPTKNPSNAKLPSANLSPIIRRPPPKPQIIAGPDNMYVRDPATGMMMELDSDFYPGVMGFNNGFNGYPLGY
ncbi:hypothetical protein ACOMHN_038211 [Nucella lapillus]